MSRITSSIVLLTALIPIPAAGQATARGTAPSPPSGTARPGLPPRDTPAAVAATPATGKIRGRVLAAETSAPLRRAQVMLLAGQLGVRRMTTTDANGRYEFTEVAEGRYNLSAGKGGYVTLQFGQRRAFEPGSQVSVADGQDLTQVDFALPRGSVIAGRITDEFGEPIAGAQIQVQRYQYTPGGQRRLTFAGGNGFVQTDDRGEFRAYGLMPGSYVVSGTVRQPPMQGNNANDASEGYAPTYYPGTPNPSEAEQLTLGLAQEMSIQLTLQAARMPRVTGTVTDSEGRPVRDGRVMVRGASGDGMMFATAGGALTADGAFSLTNVPPGDHFIEIATQGRRGSADTVPETASVRLQVSNEDIIGLRLTTAPAASISGAVQFEGDSHRGGTLGGLRVTTQSVEAERSLPVLGLDDRGRVDEDGRFQLRATGRVLFRAINLGPWMLKRVTLEGEDITDIPYDLTGAGNIEGLRVVLTDRLTDVSGTVKDARAQSVKEFVVVVQPAAEVETSALQRFLRTARPDQDGRFSLNGIPPAEYVVTAVEALEQGEEWNPEYRARLREGGRRFTVKEGESIQLDLELGSGL